jgi:hypothetical protein
MSVGTNLILFSIVTLSIYNVLLKRFPPKLILLFWVNLLSYLGFVAIYFFRSAILQHDLQALQELIFAYTLNDLPLYIAIAGAFLGSMIISEKMLDGYNLSLSPSRTSASYPPAPAISLWETRFSGPYSSAS